MDPDIAEHENQWIKEYKQIASVIRRTMGSHGTMQYEVLQNYPQIAPYFQSIRYS